MPARRALENSDSDLAEQDAGLVEDKDPAGGGIGDEELARRVIRDAYRLRKQSGCASGFQRVAAILEIEDVYTLGVAVSDKQPIVTVGAQGVRREHRRDIFLAEHCIAKSLSKRDRRLQIGAGRKLTDISHASRFRRRRKDKWLVERWKDHAGRVRTAAHDKRQRHKDDFAYVHRHPSEIPSDPHLQKLKVVVLRVCVEVGVAKHDVDARLAMIPAQLDLLFQTAVAAVERVLFVLVENTHIPAELAREIVLYLAGKRKKVHTIAGVGIIDQVVGGIDGIARIQRKPPVVMGVKAVGVEGINCAVVGFASAPRVSGPMR